MKILKIFDIFKNIEAELGLENNHLTYDNGNGQHFKTKVTDKNCFRRNNDIEENSLPWQKTDYNCRILVKIESVYFNDKNYNGGITYYPQVFLEECRYTPMNNRRLLLDDLELTDNEPESESEEEEFNENTV